MIRIPSPFLVLLLIGVIGCDPASPLGSQRFRVVGMAVQVLPAPPVAFVCCDLSEITLRDESLVREIDLDTGDLIETERIVHLRARELRSGVFFNYGVLMGPNPDSSDSVSGWFENSDTTAALLSPGWVYADGENTRTKSDWVSTATRGSAVVLQIVSSTLQRVFFLDGVQVIVSCNENNSTSILNEEDTYINITYDPLLPGCVFSPPIDLDETGATPGVPATPVDAQEFIDYVRTAAIACGFTP